MQSWLEYGGHHHDPHAEVCGSKIASHRGEYGPDSVPSTDVAGFDTVLRDHGGIDASIRVSQVDTSFQSLTYCILSSKPLSNFHNHYVTKTYLKEGAYAPAQSSKKPLRGDICTTLFEMMVDWEITTVFKYLGGIQEGRSRIKPGGVVAKPISALLRHPGATYRRP